MRNDLYDCTASQSKAQTEVNSNPGSKENPYLFPNNPDDEYTNFISFRIDRPDKQCNPGSTEINDICDIQGYYNSPSGNLKPPSQTCSSGYMFNFDDMKAGQQCILKDSELTTVPEYTIEYCPENKSTPSSIS